MALGRALRKVLIVDSGKPCNRQTPYSHNFLTQDGKTPKKIAALGKQQVKMYTTVKFLKGLATNGVQNENGFEIQISGDKYNAKKLVFATGINDVMPGIPGLAECWGISVIHCPYCHGYEVKKSNNRYFRQGAYGYEFSSLIFNWTKNLTLYTNGKSTLTTEQTAKLQQHNIGIVEDEIEKLEQENGYLQHIIFKTGKFASIKALYTRTPFAQHCAIPELLGCELSEDGYIKVDPSQKTTIPGKGLEGEVGPGGGRQPPAVGSELPRGSRRSGPGRSTTADVGVVLGRGPHHGRPADVDQLDATGRPERVEVARPRGRWPMPWASRSARCSGFDAVGQDPAVDAGVQGLDPAAEHLGRAGDRLHLGDGDPGLGQRRWPCRPRARASTPRSAQAPGQVEQPGLVVDGQQRPPDGHGSVGGQATSSDRSTPEPPARRSSGPPGRGGARPP